MVAKKNNLAHPPETKYYPCAVSKNSITMNDLANIVSSRSTMSKADCYGVMIAMSEAIGDALLEGNIVKIEALGTFMLTVQGSASNTIDDLGKANIKSSRIVYKPSIEIKRKLKNIIFKRIR